VLRKKLTKGRAEKRQGRQSQKTEKTEEDSLLAAGSILAGGGGGGEMDRITRRLPSRLDSLGEAR